MLELLILSNCLRLVTLVLYYELCAYYKISLKGNVRIYLAYWSFRGDGDLWGEMVPFRSDLFV